MNFNRILAAWCLCVGVALPFSAQAEQPTDLISNKAAIVIRLKNPTATIEKVASFVDAVQPGIGGQVRAQAQGVGMLIDNPTLAGVDKNQDWWIAIYLDAEEGTPSNDQPVFIIPLEKGKEDDLAKALGESYQFTKKGSFGIYSKDKEGFAETQKLVKGEGTSITKLIDKSSQTVFENGDVSVFVNLADLVAQHKKDFTKARKEIADDLARASENSKDVPGVDVKAALGMVGKVASAVLQGVEDSRSLVVALQIDKKGIFLEDLVRVAKDSPADAFLSKSAADPMHALSKLPAGQLLYYGAHFDLSNLLSEVAKILSAPVDGKEKQNPEVKAVLSELGTLKFGTLAGGISTGTLEDGVLRVVGVAEISDPEKVQKLMSRLYKVLSEVQTGKLKQTYKVEPEAEKYGEHTADLLTVTTSAEDKDDAELAQVTKLMQVLYGPEGAKTRIVYLEDRIVQAMGGGKEAMSAALKSQTQTDSEAGSSSVAHARKKLSEKSNFVFLLDIPGLIKHVGILMAQSGTAPIPIPAKVLSEVKLKESYLGLSFGTEEQGLRTRLYLPVEQLQGIARLAISSGMAPGGPPPAGAKDAKDDDEK